MISKKNLNPEANEQGRRARPSLSELFPGLAARFGGGGDDSSKGSSGNIHKSSINRESSVRVKPTSQGRAHLQSNNSLSLSLSLSLAIIRLFCKIPVSECEQLLIKVLVKSW